MEGMPNNRWLLIFRLISIAVGLIATVFALYMAFLKEQPYAQFYERMPASEKASIAIRELENLRIILTDLDRDITSIQATIRELEKQRTELEKFIEMEQDSEKLRSFLAAQERQSERAIWEQRIGTVVGIIGGWILGILAKPAKLRKIYNRLLRRERKPE